MSRTHPNSNINATTCESLQAHEGKGFQRTDDVKGDAFTTGIIKSIVPPSFKFKASPILDPDENPIVAKVEGRPIAAKEGDYMKVKGRIDWTYSVIADTEFTNRSQDRKEQTSRKPISVQMKSWGLEDSALYFHPEVAKECNRARKRDGLAPATVLKSECAVIDHLYHQHGYEVELSRDDDRKKEDRLLVFNIYAHFAVAELNMIFQGDLLKYIKRLQKKGLIRQQRRLMIQGDNEFQDYRVTPFKVRLSKAFEKNLPFGQFRLAIRFVDTAGLCGQAGYAAIAKNAGHILKYKDEFTSEKKGRMLDMAIERPQDFENYSLGDLELDQILSKYNRRWTEVYEKLGVGDRYREFKLTIGGTVKDLFKAVMAKALGFVAEEKDPVTGKTVKVDWQKEWEAFEKDYLAPVSANALASDFGQTKALLAKVQGGRCRNAQPSIIASTVDAILDIDISGCYGEGQRNQIYPIGTPELWSFNARSKNNQFTPVEVWLKNYEVKRNFSTEKIEDYGELVSGAWIARISTREPLSFDQDLFESWMTPSGEFGVNLMARYLKKAPSDSEDAEHGGSEFDVDYGNLKILRREIHNAILTHDLLQLVMTAPRKIIREFLKKVVVTASAVYPKSQRIDVIDGDVGEAFQKLETARQEWKPQNYRTRQRKKKVISNVLVEQECHAWIGLNLGELMIDDLLIQRKIAKLVHGKKSPQQTMFKLSVNTLYGDMVSKFFAISNPVVGNNITGRARALAFSMEKGLQTIGIITDGGAFDPNRVLDRYQFGVKPKSNHYTTLDPDGLMTLTWEKGGTTSEGKDVYLGTLKCEESGKIYFHHALGRDGGEPFAIPNSKNFDERAWAHLATVFEGLDIFDIQSTSINVKAPSGRETFGENDCVVEYVPRSGQFEFETKDVYDSAVFHGSANYKFINPNGSNLKARGYESKRPHYGYLGSGDLIENDRYGASNNPVKDFFAQLETDPTRIERQIPAVKEGILKVGEYTNHHEKYDRLGIEPGDTIRKPLLFSEFSISQFTFKSHAQWLSWEKAISRTKIKKRQSLETFFINADGTLDYQGMVEWVIDAIDRDVLDPFKELDAHRHRVRDCDVNHPHIEAHGALRQSLQAPFVEAEENSENLEKYQEWAKTLGRKVDMELDIGKKKRTKRRKRKWGSEAKTEKSEPPETNDSEKIDPNEVVTRTRKKRTRGFSVA